MVQKRQKKTKPVRRAPSQSIVSRSPFGPVSSISTAPVAIGNSIRGTQPVCKPEAGGMRVCGRDFAFQCGSTVAAATTWQLIGGMPLSPSMFGVSALLNYARIYGEFRFNGVRVPYITSSPTSQAGDVLFYYSKTHTAPLPDFTNTSFLPYILSDPHTVIGPQWTNHTLEVMPTMDWKSTCPLSCSDIDEESSGVVYLYSKTNSANSPGYVLIDYDISFREISVNPKAGLLPITRCQMAYLTLGGTSVSATSGSTTVVGTVQGTNIDGTSSALPTGAIAGDIYQAFLFPTNSVVTGTNAAWTNVTTSTLFRNANGLTGTGLTVDDGVTLFLLMLTTTTFQFYTTLENALTNTNALTYNTTATVTWNLCSGVELVRSLSPSMTQSVY